MKIESGKIRLDILRLKPYIMIQIAASTESVNILLCKIWGMAGPLSIIISASVSQISKQQIPK